ncbi:unnamed protein product, partial [Tetraodon nigroviridis]
FDSTRRQCVSEKRLDSWCKHKPGPTRSPEMGGKQASARLSGNSSNSGRENPDLLLSRLQKEPGQERDIF